MCRSISPGVTIWPAASIDLERGVGRDVVVDGGNTAARDGDVEAALVAAARIDDVPAANQQVEPHATSSAARIMSSASRRRNP